MFTQKNPLSMWHYLVALFFLISPSITMSQTNDPPRKTPAEAMRKLRLMMLTSDPSKSGIEPSKEFPRVYGIVMDLPIGENTASVVSFSTGDASLYTTSTFGVLGGIGHETVRTAAKRFVSSAEKYHDEAALTKDYPYPKPGRVNFYLVCFDGVRKLETDEESLRTGKNKYSDLYADGQKVLTELRLITQRSSK